MLLFRPVFEKLYKKLFGQNKVIGPLQFKITWYKNRHAGDQTAHYMYMFSQYSLRCKTHQRINGHFYLMGIFLRPTPP